MNSVSKVDIGTLMRKELADIKIHTFTIEMDAFPVNTKDTLIHIYSDTVATETHVRDKFYTKINNSRQRSYIVFVLEAIIGLFLFLYYMYIQS